MGVSCFICIGSNYHRESNIRLARQRLLSLFPDIQFAKPQETMPLDFSNPAMFTNLVGHFSTDWEMEQVKRKLKAIEREAGRCPEDKVIERVSLDVDLLLYGECVLKPDDLKRDYIVKGLQELNKQS
ncbi:2-amino-4-hydroxy-6-hydroxymethyldihydropteridine diphosphokinase [Bacteroides sp.]